MDNKNYLSETARKIFLAGVGALAMSAEKADELVSSMVEKGEITVEQGKTLNQELKRTVRESREKKPEAAGTKAEPAAEKPEKRDIKSMLDGLSAEELNELKQILAAKDENAEDAE